MAFSYQRNSNPFFQPIYQIRAPEESSNTIAMKGMAVWLPAKGKELEVGPAEEPQPEKGELLIEVRGFRDPGGLRQSQPYKSIANCTSQNRAIPLARRTSNPEGCNSHTNNVSYGPRN